MMNKPSRVKKNWIRPLPERLINKIAAGEVIERPAAVLKELIENSFDAGASRIEIDVRKSGTKLISVIDDGCGIEADQVEIAFARHATSKIGGFEDLENLRSFGFRGEALPSIGSVSKTRMVTRTAVSDVGTEIVVEGGVVKSVKPTAAPVGTKVEVADLFYNTPARRKFLKTESTEARHLTRNALALALSVSNIRFTYELNGRKLFSLGESYSNLKSRVQHLLLGQDGGELLEVFAESGIMNVRGYLSEPGKVRQNQHGLFIFINNRFIKSQTMVHAVTAGYGELVPKGNYPLGAVFLDIDPIKVDVNVHPTKAEVRLSEERQVHDLLYQAVKRTLRGSGEAETHGVGGRDDKPARQISISEAVRRARSFSTDRPGQPARSVIKELYGHKDILPEAAGGKADITVKEIVPETAAEARPPGEKDIGFDQVTFLGHLANLYLIFKIEDRLLIIDQHTAHERILYEENMRSIEAGGAVSQNLLFPVSVELPPDRYGLYEEAGEILRSAGFVAEPFGTRTVLLSAVPSSLSRKSPENVFLHIMDDVENLQQAGQDLKKAVAQSVACRGAVMAGDRLNEKEALALLKRLLATENRHCCPHGRPTMFKISKDELDGKFGRK